MTYSVIEKLPNTYRAFFGRFGSLTHAQKAVISPILNQQDVILQAGTGEGKTEAILAPATERLIISRERLTIIYIVPTRALAIDMYRRLDSLYRQLGLRVAIRTGDGKTLRNGTPNLLLLTPESLDVLLGSPNPENKMLLKSVRILIIDEVHTFLRTERGSHLSYLKQRLELLAGGSLQTLTLSATIPNSDEIISSFKLKTVFVYQHPPIRKLVPHWIHMVDERIELVPFFDNLLQKHQCKKILVFTSSRKKCEQLFEILNDQTSFKGHVLLHYSNLSIKKRRSVESSFRTTKQTICIATSTLEVGIDIADIDGVVLIDPPPTTTAFLQRIGRGNRKKNNLKFWGICLGPNAEKHLLKFLAFFHLAEQNMVYQKPVVKHYSVLFQQTLSCLYAKKMISHNLLKKLFNLDTQPLMMKEMVAKNWLRLVPKSGLLEGGWQYKISLKKQQIWSNFPPKDDEYEVVLERDVIAKLPLSIVKQLTIGDVFYLTGIKLKLLKIEEKKASQEIEVAVSQEPVTVDVTWFGVGVPVAFEVAQAIKMVLFNLDEPPGLETSTKQLFNTIHRSYEQGPNGVYVRRLKSGAYRFETFLGTVGNLIICEQIKRQLSSQIEGLAVHFDELGIETTAWIQFNTLSLPSTVSSFEKWIELFLPLVKKAFSWNRWFYALPKNLQIEETSSALLDLRVLDHFKRYLSESMAQEPSLLPDISEISLKGNPWSFEQEKERWQELLFPEIPRNIDLGLTASQLQSYVSHATCPRLAHFQRVGYTIKPHPILEKKPHISDFKNNVFDTLEVRFETTTFKLKDAIHEVLSTQNPLFVGKVKLEIDHPFPMKGVVDLIYLKYEADHVRLEVWGIKDQETFSYAYKWQLAFYVYLLEHLLHESSVIFSECAGLVHRKGVEQIRTPFSLLPFKNWMDRLLSQWRQESLKPPAHYTLSQKCSSCHYFSYCYQETLFKKPHPCHAQAIVCTKPETTDPLPTPDNWPSIESFLQNHFIWPIDGVVTATQVARCLGLPHELPPPVSLFHQEKEIPFNLCQEICNWCCSKVKSVHSTLPLPTNLIDSYLYQQRLDWQEKKLEILEFQKNSLQVRQEHGRAIGPLTPEGIILDNQKLHYKFSFDRTMTISKFRAGDFLKLSPVGSVKVQEGFSVILTSYSPEEGVINVQPVSKKMLLNKNQLYALDESAEDWNAPKVEAILNRLKDPHFRPDLIQMLCGHGKNIPFTGEKWFDQWYTDQAEKAQLNQMQKEALKIPFHKNVGLIEGPPGTGKTHLLAWTLKALAAHAQSKRRPIKILISALTHQAIDQILFKLERILDTSSCISLWKYGRFAEPSISHLKSDVKLLEKSEQLMESPNLILGATGFGIYQLLSEKQFPRLFDWVVFDEASQIVPSYAFLSLVFGKGNSLFFGDTQQLPPVSHSKNPTRSILKELMTCFSPEHYCRLKETYRLSTPICKFISHHWYEKQLISVAKDELLHLPRFPLQKDLIDRFLDPAKPLVFVPVEHMSNLYSSKEEAQWIAQAVKRLILDYSYPPNEIGIIAPHRLQNNTILEALKEILPFPSTYPKIDTVERMQGQEFDIVFYSATTSDQTHLHNPFLKDYRRFNVAISRARKKFLFVGTPLFFNTFPKTEKELADHLPFADFYNNFNQGY